MKKSIRILLLIALVAALVLSLAACNPCRNGHSWGEWGPSEIEGKEERVCRVCRLPDYRDIVACEHPSPIHHDAVPAVCMPQSSSNGSIEYWECGNCNKLFRDAACTDEITQADTVVLPSHSLGTLQPAVPSTSCQQDGTVAYRECTVCHKYWVNENGVELDSIYDGNVAAHDYGTLHQAVAGDCMNKGTVAYYQCSMCDQYFDSNKQLVTSIDGEYGNHKYDQDVAANDASCTQDGNYAYKHCEICDKYFNGEGIEINENDWVIPQGHLWTGVEPTWELSGSTATATFACARSCGHTEQVTDSDLDSTVTTPATCTSNSKSGLSASVVFEGNTFTKAFEEVENNDTALGHSWKLAETPYTWEDASKVTLHFVCERDCGSTKDAEISDGIAKDPEASFEADCNAEGKDVYKVTVTSASLLDGIKLTAKDVFASSVGAEITATYEVTLPARHTYGAGDWHEAKRGADCKNVGEVEHYVCSKCGEWLDAQGELIPEDERAGELGDHVIGAQAIVQAPTCLTNGIVEHYKCSVCEKTFKDVLGQQEITNLVDPATGHSFPATWTPDNAGKHYKECQNNCNEDGHREEDDCSGSYTETPDKLSHVFTCDKCGYSVTAAHDFGNAEEGRHDCECGVKLCGETTTTKSADVTLTSSTSGVGTSNTGVEEQSVTFTDGKYTFTLTLSKGTNKTNNPMRHEGEAEIRVYGANTFQITAPAGIKITSVVFTASGTSYVSLGNGASDSGSITTSGTTVTWTNAGGVGAVKFTNNASTQFRFKSFVVTYSYEEKVAVGEHVWDSGVEHQPTCTEAGYTEYTCVRCGSTNRVEGEAATGHSWENSQPTWTWDWEQMSATATFKCDKCDHTESVTDSDLEVNKVADEDCENNRKVTYKAQVQFNEKSFEQTSEQREIPETALGHDYTGKEWAPLAGTEQHYMDCTRCQEAGRKTANCDKEGLGYEEDDEEGHWVVCTVCGNDFGKETKIPHDYENDDQVCECGKPSPTHEHEWDTQWTKGPQGHWHKCLSCDEIQEEVEGDGIPSHTYNSYNSNDVEHWQVCGACNYEDEANKQDHGFTYNANDSEKHTATCDTCSKTLELNHQFGAWTTKDGEEHQHTCSDCHESYSEQHTLTRQNIDDDHQHRVFCSDCDYDVQEDHVFEGKDCVCGEPLCDKRTENDNVTFTAAGSGFNTNNGKTASISPVEFGDGKFSFTGSVGTGSSSPALFTSEIRAYANNTLTITALSGAKIKSIVFTASSGYASLGTGAASSGSISTSGTTVTWTDENGVDSVTFTNKSGAQFRFTKFVVTFSVEIVKGHHVWDGGQVHEPTCTEAGYTEFTCIRCNATRKEAGEGATGHVWENSEPTWTWDWAAMSATATFKCDKCEHTETVTDSHLEETEVTHEDCLNNRQSTYKAEIQFQGKSFDTTSEQREVVGTALGHDYVGQKWAPVEGDYEHYMDCTRCQEAGRKTDSCDLDGWDYDDDTHWAVCPICGNDFDKEFEDSHDFEGKDKCECGKPSPSHVHNWATDDNWTSDVSGHWYACLNGCEERQGFVSHDWDSITDYEHDNDSHWKYCEDCLFENDSEEAKEEHQFDSYSWNSGDKHSAHCSICDSNIELDHSKVLDSSKTSTADVHYLKCAFGCGWTGEEGHHFTDKTCDDCGYEKKVTTPTEVYTIAFNSTNNSGSVSSYTNNWYVTCNGFKWNIANCNNNNNGWDYIKAGSKSAASVASITTDKAMPETITKVCLTIDAITASSINSIKLYVSSSSDFTGVTAEGTFTKAKGTQEITISNPQPNLYYKIEIDCAKASSNGTITISGVSYWGY
ncbi:MAG: hypothetical protein J1F65_05440 [Clostridiales bacterium]|nr:hypothetical protein [Clostridiales bacterium]